MAKAPKRNAWDRLEGETEAAFRAFCAYLKANPRSIKAAKESLGLSTQRNLERWSTRHEWVERAAAWDAESERVYRQEFLAESSRVAREHAGRAAQARECVVEALMIAAQRLRDATPEELQEGIGVDEAASIVLRVPAALAQAVKVERMSRAMDQSVSVSEGPVVVTVSLGALRTHDDGGAGADE